MARIISRIIVDNDVKIVTRDIKELEHDVTLHWRSGYWRDSAEVAYNGELFKRTALEVNKVWWILVVVNDDCMYMVSTTGLILPYYNDIKGRIGIFNIPMLKPKKSEFEYWVALIGAKQDFSECDNDTDQRTIDYFKGRIHNIERKLCVRGLVYVIPDEAYAEFEIRKRLNDVMDESLLETQPVIPRTRNNDDLSSVLISGGVTPDQEDYEVISAIENEMESQNWDSRWNTEE